MSATKQPRQPIPRPVTYFCGILFGLSLRQIEDAVLLGRVGAVISMSFVAVYCAAILVFAMRNDWRITRKEWDVEK